jgi:hypothetical protein
MITQTDCELRPVPGSPQPETAAGAIATPQVSGGVERPLVDLRDRHQDRLNLSTLPISFLRSIGAFSLLVPKSWKTFEPVRQLGVSLFSFSNHPLLCEEAIDSQKRRLEQLSVAADKVAIRNLRKSASLIPLPE